MDTFSPKPLRRRFALAVVLCAAAGLLLGAGPGPAAAAGRDYGSENPPFWYPLTPFEQQTLTMAGEADSGDPEALLRIALLGAGAGDRMSYQRYRRKIAAFLDEVETELVRLGNSRERGRVLHERMHRLLLLPASQGGQPYGYRLDQSSLAVLLDTGRFNCTSSALLYLVLAGFFDLEVRAVVVPNHVFVELGTGSGAVDIETTSSSGFARVHDREFYRQQAAEWADWRGLEPVTYRDYQQREFITPLALAALNMDDFHVRQRGMDEEDRLRLKEAQSLLMAADKEKQIQRLGLYNNEYNRLSGGGDYESLVRMFTVIEPVLEEIGGRWPNDPAVAGILSWLYYQQASSFYRAGDLGRVPALIHKSLDLDQRSRNGDDDRRVRDNNLALLAEIVREFLANALYAEAVNFCDGFSTRFRGEDRFSEIYRMIYSHWGNYYWRRQEWDEALTVFNEELLRIPPATGGEAEGLLTRISGCYLNRGAAAIQAGDWLLALDLYREGLDWAAANIPERVPEFRKHVALAYQGRAVSHFKLGSWAAAADDFAKQLEWTDDPALRSSVEEKLKAVYNNWKNDFVRSGDLAGAQDVLQECVERFPGVELCREQLRTLREIHPLQPG